MARVIQIAFLLLPFGFLSMGMIHAAHLNALLIGAVFITVSQVRNPYLRAFGFYVGFWQIYLFLMLMQLKAGPAVVNLAYKFTVYIMVGAVILNTVFNSKLRNASFYNVICVAALAQATLGIMQLWNYDPVFNALQRFFAARRLIGKFELVGTMGNPNFYAAYLAISIPFFFRKHWWWCIPVLAALILSSNTFTAMIACVVGCVYYFKNRIDFKWVGASLIPFLAWVVYQKQSWTIRFFDTSYATHDRFEFWGMALRKVFSSFKTFIFGCGPGAYWGPYHGEVFPLHNDWLDVFFRFGLIGSVLVVGAFYTLYRGNKLLYSAMLIACVDAIGSYPFHLAPSLFLILIVLGLMEREKYAHSYS